MSDVSTIEFLQALYPDPVRPGRLMVRTRSRKSGKRRSHWLHTLGQVAKEAHRARTSRETLFSVPLHDPDTAVALTRRRWPKVSDRSARASEGSAVALPALWATIELVGTGAGRSEDGDRALPPDRDAAFRVFEAVRLPPSILVDAGRVVQAYWCLDGLMLLESARDRRRARDLLVRLQGVLHTAAGASGWWVDPDADLAELLRLPDTFDPDTGACARVVHFPRLRIDGAGASGDHRYAAADFDHLPAAPEVSAIERLLRARPAAATAPPHDLEPILDGCGYLEHCARSARRLHGGPYRDAVAVLARCTLGGLRGDALVHRLSEPHPGYNPRITDEQVALALSLEPPTCRRISRRADPRSSHCRHCRHFGHVDGPLDLGRPAPDGAVEARSADAGHDSADTERDVLYRLVFGLAEVLDDLGGPATARQILERLAVAPDAYPLLRSAFASLFPHLGDERAGAVSRAPLPSPIRLAGRLRTYRGRAIDGARIGCAPDRRNAARWLVRRDPSPPGGSHVE